MKKYNFKKIICIIGLFFSFFGVIWGGTHFASQVLPGTFYPGNFSFNGSVGIGTTSPGAKLHVRGRILSDYDGNNEGGEFVLAAVGQAETNITWHIDTHPIGDNRIFRIFEQPNITTSGITHVVIQNGTGNVGIGTTSPGTKLEVNGGIANDNFERKYLGKGGMNDYDKAVILLHPIYDGTLIEENRAIGHIYASRGWNTASNRKNAVFIHTGSAYNGVTGMIESFGEKWELKTCTYNSVKYFCLEVPYLNPYLGHGFYFDGQIVSTGEALKVIPYYDTNPGTVLNAEIHGSLAAFTVNQNRYIDANIVSISGNVGIGTTAPNVALDVIGSIEYTGTITDVSDMRLKENIIPIDNGLAKVSGLYGYTFNMINDTTRQAGVMAQDLQKVLPVAVSVIDNEGHLGVDYTQIVPLLVEAVKELKEENEAKQIQIDELKQIICLDHPTAVICSQ